VLHPGRSPLVSACIPGLEHSWFGAFPAGGRQFGAGSQQVKIHLQPPPPTEPPEKKGVTPRLFPNLPNYLSVWEQRILLC
jgi:hypothetical protein